MAENKNQISTQEWSERMRSAGRQATTSPVSVSRAPVNTSGPLAQIRQNLTALNNQKYGLALANIKGQYNLADKMASLTQDINANAIARKEQLYANRQANLDRMAQMYGQYYQQFGNVLNKDALDFLDQHSNIKVPTLTAIMAGYEHARASRAEQALAALDRTAKMADAEAALAEKQTALENEKAATEQYANLQRLDAQSKANQAVYDAQKALLDEQARNELIGAGLASTGRGTGVRALPGFGGGIGAGARAGVGRVPSAVTGARSGETVTGGVSTGAPAPVARVVQTADGQTVAVDNNRNVIGSVVPTQNGSVVVNDNGQTVGSVDANGNVVPTQQSLYAQYKANTNNFFESPVSTIYGGLVDNRSNILFSSLAANKIWPEGRIVPEGFVRPSVVSRTPNVAGAIDWDGRTIYGPNNSFTMNDPNFRYSRTAAQGATQTATQGATQTAQTTSRTGRIAALRQSAANRMATTKGLLGRYGGRLLGGLTRGPVGWATTLAMFAPEIYGGAHAIGQMAENFYDDFSGARSWQVANALANGQPIPRQPSAFSVFTEKTQEAQRNIFGRLFDTGMVNGEDVQNFSTLYEGITGSRPDFDTKVIFDKQNDVVRTQILDRMLSGELKELGDIHNLIKDTINTYSNPQEQRAIQQEIQAEKDQIVFNQSISSTTGHNKLVEAVTRELGNRLGKLGYNFDYEDLAMFANAYPDMVSWIETRNKAGVGNKTTSATSMYQMTKDFFDYQKKYILNNFYDTLPAEQKDRLIKATKASDLDNDLDRPILRAMVLANVYNNLAVNNQHFDKQGPNIRSDQMAGDVISMMKDTYKAGQFDENGLFFNPALAGNLARIWAVSFFKGTDPKAVREAYNNVNNSLNEAWGFRRDEQGNNLPWWDGTWNTPQRYREMLGMSGAQTQAQRAGYGFDVAPGVDVDRMNNLMVYRVNALNDLMAPTGVKVRMNSGFRDYGKQDELYRNKGTNPNPVGKPGWSKHQTGTVADLNDPDLEKAFNANKQLVHQYGTYDNALKSIGLQRGITDKNGKRTDLVHYSMIEDDEYHDAIDHDRLMASRGNWGKEPGNYWMRGVGSVPRQVQPAWDVSPQYMVENFGYPTMQYPATDYDPDLIFAGNQNGYVFDYDYDEDGNQNGYVFDYDYDEDGNQILY